jgi:hypothetical protein
MPRKLPLVRSFEVAGLTFEDMRRHGPRDQRRAIRRFKEEFTASMIEGGYTPIEVCEDDGIDAEVLKDYVEARESEPDLTLKQFLRRGGAVKVDGDFKHWLPSLMLTAKRNDRFVGGIFLFNMQIERDDTILRAKANTMFGIAAGGGRTGAYILKKMLRHILEHDLRTGPERPNIDIVQVVVPRGEGRRWSVRKFPAFAEVFEELEIVCDRTDDSNGDPDNFRRRGVSE